MTGYVEQMDAAIPSAESIRETRERLESEGVKYLLPAWIDLFGVPKTKPVPMSDFEDLCIGKGPQFAVHSVSYVPELTPADPDQINHSRSGRRLCLSMGHIHGDDFLRSFLGRQPL